MYQIYVSGQVYVKNKCRLYFSLFQRALTALRAISDLRFGESFAARALPPLRPPSFPKATAAGFFSFSTLLFERLVICEVYKIVKLTQADLIAFRCIRKVGTGQREWQRPCEWA